MDKPHAKPVELRMTRQRRVILEELDTPGRHPTADSVYQRVRLRIPNISLGTVYRNLEILSQAGLIRKLHIGSGQKRYDRALHKHYHIRCVQCGRINDVPAGPFGDLEAAASGNSDFDILGHELEFEGLCEQCKDMSPEQSEQNQEFGRIDYGT
ncbi:MAG: transcriptional repressor [Phycisphaerae bacterium]|nr:transcriptional repressor [Phycisphaerae bacterium]